MKSERMVIKNHNVMNESETALEMGPCSSAVGHSYAGSFGIFLLICL